MNAALPLSLAAAMTQFVPTQSVVHQITSSYPQDHIGTEAYAERRAWFRDECRSGFDCGPDEDDDEDFEGVPV